MTTARVRGVIAPSIARTSSWYSLVVGTATALRSGHHHGHLVVEVVRHQQHDLVVWIGNREDGVHEGLVAAGGYEHAAPRPDGDVVLARELGLDRRDELRQPLDRTVAMVGQRAAELARGLDGLGRRLVGDDPLTERDRPGRLGRPAADDGDDGSLDGLEAP